MRCRLEKALSGATQKMEQAHTDTHALQRSLQVRYRCLCCAVLCCAVLCCAVLCCAVLCCAVPCRAVPCPSRVFLLLPPQSETARAQQLGEEMDSLCSRLRKVRQWCSVASPPARLLPFPCTACLGTRRPWECYRLCACCHAGTGSSALGPIYQTPSITPHNVLSISLMPAAPSR